MLNIFVIHKTIKRIVQVCASLDRDWRRPGLVRLYRRLRRVLALVQGLAGGPEWGAGHPGLRTLHLTLDSLLISLSHNILVRSNTLGCASLF